MAKGSFRFPIYNGGELPDPAIFCPAKGYYNPSDPTEYIPDPNLPETPEPGTGEIILVCTTALDAAINVATYTSSGQAIYTIYGANDALIYSQNVSSGLPFFYEFPSVGGIELTSGLQAFRVVITPSLGNIIRFSCRSKTSWAPLGWPILECHIKCPDLTLLSSAFLNQKYIQLIKFYGPADALIALSDFAEGTDNLKQCILPTSLESLNSMSQSFYNSGVENVIIQASSMPSLGSLSRAFSASKIKTNPLADIALLPSLTTYAQAFSNTSDLKVELVLPEAPICTSILYVALSSAISKLIFRGVMNGAISGTDIQGIVVNAHNVTEVVMPTEMLNIDDFIYTWRDAGSLKKITLPLIANLSHAGQGAYFWFKGTSNSVKSDNVEEMTECNWTVPPTYFLSLSPPRKMTSFNQPTLKPNRVSVTSSSLTYFNIDFSGLDPAYEISLRSNQFDAAELERISGLLPVVDSGIFRCGYNPGYNTFDKTIAEAKGWTVYT